MAVNSQKACAIFLPNAKKESNSDVICVRIFRSKIHTNDLKLNYENVIFYSQTKKESVLRNISFSYPKCQINWFPKYKIVDESLLPILLGKWIRTKYL